MKPLNKFKTAILTAAMVFGLSAGAFAAAPDSATYMLDAAATTYETPITVTLDVQSKKVGAEFINEKFAVTLNPGTTAKSFNVCDVLVAAQENPVNNISFLKSDNTQITGTSTYAQKVKRGTTVYEPTSAYAMDGWMCRVNGMLPIQPDGWGATISSTHIKANDVISFYCDDPTSADTGAKFTRVAVINGIINVKESHQWFAGANWDWFHPDYANYASAKAIVLDENESEVIPLNSIANVNSAISALPTGTYTVKIPAVFKANKLIDSTYSTTTFIK